MTSILHWFETELLTKKENLIGQMALNQEMVGQMARRVVAKVEFLFGELFPRVCFIVTNLSLPSRAVVCFL